MSQSELFPCIHCGVRLYGWELANHVVTNCEAFKEILKKVFEAHMPNKPTECEKVKWEIIGVNYVSTIQDPILLSYLLGKLDSYLVKPGYEVEVRIRDAMKESRNETKTN